MYEASVIHRSTGLQRVDMGKARPPGARLVEVEQGRRRDVVVQWPVSAAGLPPEGLDLDTQVVGEMDGVRDMQRYRPKRCWLW